MNYGFQTMYIELLPIIHHQKVKDEMQNSESAYGFLHLFMKRWKNVTLVLFWHTMLGIQ